MSIADFFHGSILDHLIRAVNANDCKLQQLDDELLYIRFYSLCIGIYLIRQNI